MHRFIVRAFLTFLMLPVLSSAARTQEAATGRRAQVQRIVFTLNIAAKEYGLGVAGGRVVNPGEYGEAVDFTAAAAAQYERAAQEAGLSAAKNSALKNDFKFLQAKVRDKEAPEDVRRLAEGLRVSLEKSFGVSTHALPMSRPSLDSGRRIYLQNCAACHGAAGDGKGPAAAALQPPPPAFTEKDFMRAASPLSFFQTVAVGVGGTAMASWAETLSESERWDVVAYLWSFTLSPRDIEKAEKIYERARGRLPGEFKSLKFWAERSELEASALLTGRPEAGLSGEEAALLSAYWRSARKLEAGGEGDSAPQDEIVSVIAQVKASLAGSLEFFDRGAFKDSADAALEAYLRYERIEARAASKAPEDNRYLESAFPLLRAKLLQAAPRAEIINSKSGIEARLDRLRRALDRSSSPAVAFLQSLTIILREGFEAILIIAALIAYLKRAGHADKLRTVYRGAALGVAASFATAWAAQRFLRTSALNQESLEGVVMLAAAAVLFYVSFWLLAKAEAEKWRSFIRGQLQGALGSGSAAMLGFAAFLAVYREGFETVLFYQALLGFAAVNKAIVLAGFLAGAALLAVLFVSFYRLEVRIPMRTFFVATSGMLYALAFSFMGRGLHELQGAGWVSLHPFVWMRELPFLGIYPTWETLMGQALLVMALAAGWAFTRRKALSPEMSDPDGNLVEQVGGDDEGQLRKEIGSRRQNGAHNGDGQQSVPAVMAQHPGLDDAQADQNENYDGQLKHRSEADA
ncbi:MAG: hypothetical protein A3G41_03195 [Elusimicrobia bacterium RIFCSPLOWO2_12_FULL_59_9]|nr:MAG: hypothetical protein A3G41_03195 [Elusimicrobia bacterium RIFCSPLOWO2_12_FULL_59_9]